MLCIGKDDTRVGPAKDQELALAGADDKRFAIVSGITGGRNMGTLAR